MTNLRMFLFNGKFGLIYFIIRAIIFLLYFIYLYFYTSRLISYEQLVGLLFFTNLYMLVDSILFYLSLTTKEFALNISLNFY